MADLLNLEQPTLRFASTAKSPPQSAYGRPIHFEKEDAENADRKYCRRYFARRARWLGGAGSGEEFRDPKGDR
jgi:hypothetical protein